MKHPEKWRETCDPFALPYHEFQPEKILGYPHAGNDVFHVLGRYQGKEIRAYIKAARQKGAALENERKILEQRILPVIPRVLDSGMGDIPFLVTEEMPGQRLSVLLGENKNFQSLEYLEEYGEMLAQIHQMKPSANPAADRRFFHAPSQELLARLELTDLAEFLAQNPAESKIVFCHGDFHYANLLWENHHISGILDFELSGWGNRDFDIAWALILRPGQKFLKTEEERACFLRGYQKYSSFDEAAVRYYMAQIYCYFLTFSGDEREYCDYVRSWLAGLI